MITNLHEARLFRSLCDADLNLLAALKFHPGRFGVAQIYDSRHGAHHVLCGPGTRHTDWLNLDVHTMLAIGDWRPGFPAFDRTISLMRYEDAIHAGRGERHGVHVLYLGDRFRVAEAAEEEIARRESERERWESQAA